MGHAVSAGSFTRDRCGALQPGQRGAERGCFGWCRRALPRSCQLVPAGGCLGFAADGRLSLPLGDLAGRGPRPDVLLRGTGRRGTVRVPTLKEETMTTIGYPRYLVATQVKAGRDDDFERFMRDVVVPAEVRARPHQVGMWQLMRPATDQPEGVKRAWLMAFYGPSTLVDWSLEDLFVEAYGADAWGQHMRYFEDMIEGEQTVYAVDGENALTGGA